MKQKKKEKPKTEDSQKGKKSEQKELHETIESLQKEKDELFSKLQRVSADYANFQKRVPKQISDTICYEKEKIIKTLLPALDNFEHTLQSAHSAEDADVFVKGVQIIYDQMLDILKSHGIEQIKAPGENFDPALHEAMMQKTDPEVRLFTTSVLTAIMLVLATAKARTMPTPNGSTSKQLPISPPQNSMCRLRL